MPKQCSKEVKKTHTHTHSTDQHKSYPASQSATEHASCSRRPLTKRSAGSIDRCRGRPGRAGVDEAFDHFWSGKETASRPTGSCSRMGPCAGLCLGPGRRLGHGTRKAWALRSWHHKDMAGLVICWPSGYLAIRPCTCQVIKLWNGEQVLQFMSKQFMIDICNSNVMKRTARFSWSVMNIDANAA